MVSLLAATAAPQRDLVSPREWVRLLGGVDLAPVPALPDEPVDVAMFRFADLPERSSCRRSTRTTSRSRCAARC